MPCYAVLSAVQKVCSIQFGGEFHPFYAVLCCVSAELCLLHVVFPNCVNTLAAEVSKVTQAEDHAI